MTTNSLILKNDSLLNPLLPPQEAATITFDHLGLSPSTLKRLREKNFHSPTPIQQKIIPLILQETSDIIGKSQTGTGKTAAFGLPIMEKLREFPSRTPEMAGDPPKALILVPTRELALQVCQELNALQGDKKLRIVPIYGGQSMGQQLKWLKRGVDIVVGTPGRILDHLSQRTLALKGISYLVLDEADEMLNMGFQEDMEAIFQHTSEKKRVLLFSATMAPRILNLAQNFMGAYKKVEIRPQEQTTQLIDQSYLKMAPGDKFEVLCRLIDFQKDFYGLVFCRTKIEVDDVTRKLDDRGYDVEAIHGDLSQGQREKVMGQFKSKKVKILVATDVAARGIDVQNLGQVVNYSLPRDPESYVHRIGRTGRSGKEGKAWSFVTTLSEDFRSFSAIKSCVKKEIRQEKIPSKEDIINNQRMALKEQIVSMGQDHPLETPTGEQKEFINLATELLKELRPEVAISILLELSFKGKLNPRKYGDLQSVTDTKKLFSSQRKTMFRKGPPAREDRFRGKSGFKSRSPGGSTGGSTGAGGSTSSTSKFKK